VLNALYGHEQTNLELDAKDTRQTLVRRDGWEYGVLAAHEARRYAEPGTKQQSNGPKVNEGNLEREVCR
jgi:hypothetical protein